MRRRVPLLVCLAATLLAAADPELYTLSGDLERVHDPVIARERDTYYVFSTNRAPKGHIPIRCSTDLRHWTLCGAVFEELPKWVATDVPGARSLWAPDISYFNGKYHLYYSASTFGKNRSAIGLVVNETLDPQSPRYKWIDQGPVIQSYPEDDYNCIDPNLVVDREGRSWLLFGSFWGGVKMRRVDPSTGKLSGADERLYSLATRPHEPGQPNPIEAPFLVRHGRFYYLFVSFDFCCRGAKSTYNVVVGRSAAITGPYRDQSGRLMTEGGGTRLTAGTEQWRGPGHPGLLMDHKPPLMVFHAYDGKTGRPSLHITTLVWKHGWPRVAPLP